MSLLRRTLGARGTVLAIVSVLLLLVPNWLVGSVLGQSDTPDVWMRLFGAAGLSLAMFHVLILRKLDELWWWSWAIVVFDALTAVIAALHVSIGLPEGSAAWPWWVVAALAAASAALALAGMARAGQERPFA
jgi:hypothetical protein